MTWTPDEIQLVKTGSARNARAVLEDLSMLTGAAAALILLIAVAMTLDFLR